MEKSDVIWLRPRYTERPNFDFACQVLRFDASRRGHTIREPLLEYSRWAADTRTFTLADEKGEIARMSFSRRTIRWKLAGEAVAAARTGEPSGH
jgi:hypothetical protein